MENHLKKLREAAGLTADALATFADTTRQQIYRLESGERKMTKEWAERLAPHLKTTALEILFGGIASKVNLSEADHRDAVESYKPLEDVIAAPLIGEVSAGTWLETGEVFSGPIDTYVPAVRQGHYPRDAYYSLRVKGNSINLIARDGEILICLDVQKSGARPKHNDLVIVQRVKEQGSLIETTAKIMKVKNNIPQFWPSSDDPRYQDPIAMNDGDWREIEVRIIAIAVGKYFPFGAQGLEID